MKSYLKSHHLVLATRGSALALFQARFVVDRIKDIYPQYDIDILPIKTTADKMEHVSLAAMGGKDLFVKELEEALLSGAADFAVHSLKDIATCLNDQFVLAAFNWRLDPADVLVAGVNVPCTPPFVNQVIGTSSPRRVAGLRHTYPDVIVKNIRGNIDRRLRRVDHRDYDAVILAAAGVIRLQLTHRVSYRFDPTVFIPCAGQGCLAIEILSVREDLKQFFSVLNSPVIERGVCAERTVSKTLQASCHTAMGAFAQMEDGGTVLYAQVFSPDGAHAIRAQATALVDDVTQAHALGERVAGILLQQGAADLMAHS